MKAILVLNFPTLYQWALNSYITELKRSSSIDVLILDWREGNQKFDISNYSTNDYLVLIGNLKDFSKNDLSEDMNLIRLIQRFPGERIWHLYGDLDHRLEHILFGYKTNKSNLHESALTRKADEYLSMFKTLIWSFEQHVDKNELPYFPIEKTKQILSISTEERFELLLQTQERLKDKFDNRIEWQHCIEASYIEYIAKLKPKLINCDITAIGAEYSSRVYALEELRRLGMQVKDNSQKSKSIATLRALVSQAGFRLGVDSEKLKYFLFQIYFLEQQSLYLRASSAYVDTGYYGTFMRKYVESAFMGCALIGTLSSGIANLGFENNYNFIAIPNHQDGIAERSSAIQDRDLHRSMNANLRRLIVARHSSKVRASQIDSAIRNRDVKGVSMFIKGNYNFLPRT
jgi:glycosyltransferase involved in cell wall biosynthesis